MAGDTCYTPIRGLAARATRLDTCGRAVTGANNSAVTCGYTSLAWAADVEAGTDITVKNAAGDICCSQKGCPKLKGFDLTGAFCQVDPEFVELVSSARLLTDTGGNTVGYAPNEDVECDGFALEVWQEICDQECDPGAAVLYVYTLFPRIINGVFGDFTIEEGPTTLQLKAYAESNANWGDPYNVGQTPATKEPYLQFLTASAPPTCVCGYTVAA
jgi:hypothetical protein